MNKKKLFWFAFTVLLLVFAVIQFVPSPPVIIPAQIAAGEREEHRLLNFGAIHNFRDLGGYVTSDGRRVRWGRLYRTGTLAEATAADLRALQQLNLAYLVDFRSAAEKEEEPNRLPDPPGFELIEIPVLDEGNEAMVSGIREQIESGDFDDFDPNQFMVTANRQFATEFTPEFRQFIQQVLQAGGAPVAWHCTAGKDRTGFASAILLRILGVPLETVMSDYMASKQHALEARRGQLTMLRLFEGEETADKIGVMLGVEETWLQAALDEIDTRWGGFDNYVHEGLLLSAADVDQLRSNLLE